jgi:rod shape-determining protein MreD
MALLAVQTSIFNGLPEWIGVPDLLFILIVFSAIYLQAIEGVILCLVLGTAIEVFSGYYLGFYVLSYILVFFLIRSVSAVLAIKEPSQQPAVAALAYLLANGLVYVFSAMLAEESLSPWSWGVMLQRVLIITVLTIPFNRIFHVVMQQCDKKYEKRSFFRKRYGKNNRYRPKTG